MNAQELTIASGDIVLAGTLTTPQDIETNTLVICAHGSGPLDRNSDVAAQKLSVFDAIADHLGTHGFATFRYDKRGIKKSTGNFKTAGYSDFLFDLRSVHDHFANQHPAPFEKIYILGHSEGTMLAVDLANMRDVAGIILLTPFVEDMETTLIKQAQKGTDELKTWPGFTGKIIRFITRIAGTPMDQQLKLIERVKSTNADTIRMQLFNVISAKWMRELMQLDPPAAYARLNCPTLVIGREKDLQCNPEDVAKIEAIIGDKGEYHLMDNLSHLLRYEDGKASFQGYRELLKKPIETDLLDLVSNWLKRQSA